MMTYGSYKVHVPAGELGDARIEKFTVSQEESDLDKLIGAFGGHRRYCPPGDYTRLIVGQTLMMSDTPDEIVDHLEFIYAAKGRVLINGLGLGVVLQGVLSKEDVDFVRVIEINPNVISLVEPYFADLFGRDKFEVICADALEYKAPKGERFNAVWHDIWPHICTDNWPEYCKLHRKYGQRCDYQDSWQRSWLLYEKQRERNWW